jgi:prevent-host-death family protein
VAKRYSIADARRNIAGVVRDVRAGISVQLTCRAEPVAVVLSIDRYEELEHGRGSLGERYRAFRERYPVGTGGVDRGYLRSLRDRSRGRKVAL